MNKKVYDIYSKHNLFLNFTKNSIIGEWVLKKYNIPKKGWTNAWRKIYELIYRMKLVDCNNTGSINHFDICGYPGAFIFAVNHYVKTRTKFKKYNWNIQSYNEELHLFSNKSLLSKSSSKMNNLKSVSCGTCINNLSLIKGKKSKKNISQIGNKQKKKSNKKKYNKKKKIGSLQWPPGASSNFPGASWGLLRSPASGASRGPAFASGAFS